MKLYSKKEIISILLILATAAIGWYFYPQLPDQVPSHWNISGQIDGWMNKSFAVWFFPSLTLFLYVLLSVFPLMDPRKKNIELFSHLYFWFKVAFVLFMSALYLVTLYAALGYDVNVGRLVSWGIAVLFLMLGLMIPKLKQNYTIGIRLPWTLHSEKVWDKTHKLGGWLFIILAVLMLVIGFCPNMYTFWALMGGIVLMIIILFAYAYWEYRKLEK